MLEENKICVISCVNNDMLYNETMCYLQQQLLPEGMELEVIKITNAANIFEGYQQAMMQSSAKYKFYLHQDVNIISPSLIKDIVDAFLSNPALGILGVVGGIDLPPNGVWWEGRIAGAIIDNSDGTYREKMHGDYGVGIIEAKALDGLLLATQYDIAWRGDIFGGWHLYDTSQCLEFRRAGYKVGILTQEKPACVHKCGKPSMNGYNNALRVLQQEYSADIAELNPSVMGVKDLFEKWLSWSVKRKCFDMTGFINFMEAGFATNGFRNQAVEPVNNIVIIFDGTESDYTYTARKMQQLQLEKPKTRLILVYPDRLRQYITKHSVANLNAAINYSDSDSLKERFEYYASYAVNFLLYYHFSECYVYGDNIDAYILGYLSGAEHRHGMFPVRKSVRWEYSDAMDRNWSRQMYPRGDRIIQDIDDKKIAFVINTSSRKWLDQCLNYINRLDIPAGYKLEIIPVENAQSMASGYNTGMMSSNAKYKVYLHQDCFILHEAFLYDMLRLFEDSSVGIMGVIGTKRLSASGIWWDELDNVRGGVFLYDMSDNGNPNNILAIGDRPYTEVEALDGIILATQYDLPWREDLFDGWHFYDISQCQEFIKNGLKVVVPYQEAPWVIHCNGKDELGKDYHKYRDIFIQEYGK